MLDDDIKHYINVIKGSFEVSQRTPHTYIILNIENVKMLKYIEFKKTVYQTFKMLCKIAKDSRFIAFVGFDKIKRVS